MTKQQHPITPPPELVQKWAWFKGDANPEALWLRIANCAAQWGYDQRGEVNEAELQKARDKDQLDQARTINDEIEVSVLGPSGMDTPPCAEAWSTAKLIAELRSRVEALEADDLRAARRPKTPILKGQELKLLELYNISEAQLTISQRNTIRRALEALPDD
ncbi:MAG: hypothetical protein EBR05_10645 [Marivivens sp.]|nr:hypothetical protein [Marivivens sp.]NBX10234.1 hypothetical protein [Marivivens sp.]NCW70310.1 hypothetical protein [Marivivens sp.]